MKKRLLLGLMAMCMAGSSFALEVNECVYTPQGRYKITGANVASSNFVSFDGWTVVTASEQAIDANFSLVQDGDIWCAQSLSATEGEGMSFKFVPSSADGVYVVSYKMKGAPATSIRVKTVDVQTNLVTITGEADGVDPVVVNKAEELTADWQTFNYAIVGDGNARTYTISFTGMATDIEIADLQIAPAAQIADLRQRDVMLEKMITYRDVYDWPADVLNEVGYNEVISSLETVDDETSQADLEDILLTADAILYGEGGFLATNMDDYLAGNNRNYLPYQVGGNNERNFTNFGDWACTPSGRACWEKDSYLDIGHFQNSNSWCNNAPDNPMGLSIKRELTKGAYVFTIDVKAAVREPKKNTWTLDDGMKPAYGIAYVCKVDGETRDTIAKQRIEHLDAVQFTTFVLPAKVETDGNYEFGMMAYCYETHKTLKCGSVVFVTNATIWGKNENKYNQKELNYEADVREQITAGRTNLTTAAGYLADANKFWGKTELQACIDTIEVKIANYELLDQDAIIATFDADSYNKANSTKNAEEGLLVFEVYDTAVKDILAANRRFVAVNDTLESLQAAIDAAEAVLASRLYSAATGKADLQDEIEAAKGLLVSMKKLEYSEENASFIEAEKLVLSEAVEEFKVSVPAEAITTIVDIDFVQDPVQNPETQLYSISGAAGTMDFDTYNGEGAENSTSFEKGFWSNGELIFSDVLRVGNGSGTVTFDPTNGTGSMDSNILKVEFDYYYGSLSGKNAGFYIYNGETEAAALFISKYSGTEVVNTFGLDRGLIPAVGSSAANNDAICVETNKTHFEIVFDFGEKSMYCSTNANGKSQTSEKKPFAEATLTSFVVKSDYNNSGRRCWFDNLKIEKVTASSAEPFTPDGIEEIVNAENKVVAPSKVLKNGRIVINGKYGINGVLIK